VLALPAPRHTRTNVGSSRDKPTRLLCLGPSRVWASSDAQRIVVFFSLSRAWLYSAASANSITLGSANAVGPEATPES
jgi:hypothetical protein